MSGESVEGATPNLADVDDLFARLRAGAHSETDADDTEGVVSDAAATDAGATQAASDDEAEINITGADDSVDEIPAWLSRRDETLAPLRVGLVRQIKLAIGDEQNEVLDKVRRHKGPPKAVSVLPAVDPQTEAWAKVVMVAASEAYQAGRRAEGGDAGTVPDDLSRTIARTMVEPLRDRLVAAVDGSHEPGETTHQVAERIGARYREWKNHSAEASVEDALVGAYARGTYDAASEDRVLSWSTPPGGCCPDCTDNALEPTKKGDAFPTGQPYPPAHPGCRCTIVSVVSGARPGGGVEAESTTSN